MQGNGNAAEVIAVGHDLKGQQADDGMFQGMDGTHEVQKAFFQPHADDIRNHIPEAIGFKNLGRRVQRRDAQQAVAGGGALFVAGDPFGDAQPAPADQRPAQSATFRLFQNVRTFLAARAREPGNPGFSGQDSCPTGVHLFNDVAAAPVQIDRAGVRLAPGPEAVHRTDERAVLILNAVAPACAAQVHQTLGPFARGQPLRAVSGLQQQAFGAQRAHGPARAR